MAVSFNKVVNVDWIAGHPTAVDEGRHRSTGQHQVRQDHHEEDQRPLPGDAQHSDPPDNQGPRECVEV